MKIRYLAVILFLSLFLFTGAKSADDFLSDFSKWIGKMETISERVEKMEADLDSISKEKEEAISKLSNKIDELENKTSNQLLDTLKEGLAEIRKTVEDQQVITAVLEKKYLQAEMPLESIKETLEEQKQSMANIAARIDAQDKRINLITDNIDKKLAPLDDLSSTIDKKLASISKLTDLISEIEKRDGDLSKIVSSIPVETKAANDATKEEKESEKKEEEKKEFTIADALKAQGYQEIREGFFLKDLEFKTFGSSAQVSGSILNSSEKDYSIANFKIFVYDDQDTLIRGQDFSLKGLRKGNVEKFQEVISGVRREIIKKYAVAFGKNVQSYEITNLTEIVEKKTLGEEFAEQKSKEKAESDSKIEKGFKDIGNNFYIKDIEIKKFGSSCEMNGELKNNSAKYCSIASLNIKIYDKLKVLIWDQDFSVKSIPAGSVKLFSEILTGIEPEDIALYEIKAKN